jgi:uncharacterized protein Yka (UPF0111/DUF47 family)
MRHWFLPDVPDVLGLLRAQARTTLTGLEAFAAWSRAEVGADERVRSTEEESGVARRAVQTALRQAFSTPIDPEDVYELSERLGVVLTTAKNVVREAEVLDMAPDPAIAAMAADVVEGQRHLVRALDALDVDDDLATRASDDAVASCDDVERQYVAAMSRLLAADDLREVVGRRELYRRLARTAAAVEQVAERVWYAVVKSP